MKMSHEECVKQFAVTRLTELKEIWENDVTYNDDEEMQADCDALEIALNIIKYGSVCDKDCEHCNWITCLLEEDKEEEKTDGKKEETGNVGEGEESSNGSRVDEVRRNQDITF